MTDPLRVLLVAGEFPLASETFVRRQCLEPISATCHRDDAIAALGQYPTIMLANA